MVYKQAWSIKNYGYVRDVSRSMETAETTMETDGDGSEGTSTSWQGARTETSVPQNSSAAAAELWNSF
jgi:hypothetical protein